MVPAGLSEVDERMARLRPAPGNGTAARRPSPDDLDWVLFHSFPGSEVDPGRLADLLPVYERALAKGIAFDAELLYVRILELGDKVAEETRASVAQAAARRVLAGGFDPADAIASIRFVIRALPRSGDFVQRLLADPGAARLRFDLTTDFLLDERDLPDYLALSYLREGDPDAEPALAPFRVPPDVSRRLAEFFDESECRRRVQEGWAAWTDVEDRATLCEALRSRWPEFAPRDRD